MNDNRRRSLTQTGRLITNWIIEGRNLMTFKLIKFLRWFWNKQVEMLKSQKWYRKSQRPDFRYLIDLRANIWQTYKWIFAILELLLLLKKMSRKQSTVYLLFHVFHQSNTCMQSLVLIWKTNFILFLQKWISWHLGFLN